MLDSRALSGREITQWEEAQTWSQTRGLRDSIPGAGGMYKRGYRAGIKSRNSGVWLLYASVINPSVKM